MSLVWHSKGEESVMMERMISTSAGLREGSDSMRVSKRCEVGFSLKSRRFLESRKVRRRGRFSE